MKMNADWFFTITKMNARCEYDDGVQVGIVVVQLLLFPSEVLADKLRHRVENHTVQPHFNNLLGTNDNKWLFN